MIQRIPSFVDLYHEDADPDMHLLARLGVLGMALKATENDRFADPAYHERIDRALQVWPEGTLSYHMLGGAPVRLQVQNFLNWTRGHKGLVLDWEKPECSLEMCLEAAHRLMDALGHNRIIIYGPEGLITEALDKGHFGGLGLWIANPSHAPNCRFNLWQFGAPDWHSGKIPGYPVPMDVNAFHGTPDQLKGWLRSYTQ